MRRNLPDHRAIRPPDYFQQIQCLCWLCNSVSSDGVSATSRSKSYTHRTHLLRCPGHNLEQRVLKHHHGLNHKSTEGSRRPFQKNPRKMIRSFHLLRMNRKHSFHANDHPSGHFPSETPSYHPADLLRLHSWPYNPSPESLIPTSSCTLCSSRRNREKTPTVTNCTSTFRPRFASENIPLRAFPHSSPFRYFHLWKNRIRSWRFQSMGRRWNKIRSMSPSASESTQRTTRWSSCLMKPGSGCCHICHSPLGQDDWLFHIHRILSGRCWPCCSMGLKTWNILWYSTGFPAIPGNSHRNSRKLPLCPRSSWPRTLAWKLS